MAPTRHNNVTAAALWMAGALISFMTLAVCGRELSRELQTFQILFMRSFIGFIIISLLVWRSGWAQLRTPQIGRHVIRNIAHFGGQYGWFYGLAFIPLAQVFAIEFTVPIWTAVWAYFLLRERLNRYRVAAIFLGLTGLFVILRPGFITVQPAALAVLGGAVGFAFSHTMTRYLTRQDTALTVLFFMTLMQMPMGLIPALGQWVTPSVALWPWLFLVGIAGLSAHFCLTKALSLADATVVVPMDFLRLPLIALVGFLFYNEPLDWFVLLGGGIMLLGNWINVRAEQRRLVAQSVSAK